MTGETLLDRAFVVMEAGGEAERRAFFRAFTGCELFLMLSAQAEGDQITPEIFDVDGTGFVLVFDREDRLAAFATREVPYVGLSGRALVGMLAGSALGVAVNPDVAPSATLVDADTVTWLAGLVEDAPEEHDARIAGIAPPAGLPEALLTTLDAHLAGAAGLAASAYLVGITFETGARGHMLGFVDAVPGAEPSLAALMREALVFSGLEAATLEVGFFRAGDAMAARLLRQGLRFDLPAPAISPALVRASRPAPGSDPDRPPKLK